MSREEQIEQAADEFAGVNYDCETEADAFYHHVQKEAFSAGAKWADKNMLEIACKWLKKSTILADTTIERFRKAMEEQQ